MMKNKSILLISPEPWGANFVSKHHYARYLAKHNRVFFLNPPTGYAKTPINAMQISATNFNPNLTIIRYVNLVPRLDRLSKKLQLKIYQQQAQRILKYIDTPIDLVWSFDPFRFFDQHVWQVPETIYHTVDFHPNAKFETDLIQSSKHFLGVADLILKEHEKTRLGKCIPHAADLDGFNQHEEINLPGENKIKACYVGNFHKHIDYHILEQLIVENRDTDFILIGPTHDSNLSSGNIGTSSITALSKEKNAHFIGSIPPFLLMSYLKQCHINLVLFKKENEKIHCSPHKLMGYFYSGNITLSNYIDAHKNTGADIITMVDDQSQIPPLFSQIKTNLDYYNSAELKKKRQSFAIANSYERKIEEIGVYIESGN